MTLGELITVTQESGYPASDYIVGVHENLANTGYRCISVFVHRTVDSPQIHCWLARQSIEEAAAAVRSNSWDHRASHLAPKESAP